MAQGVKVTILPTVEPRAVADMSSQWTWDVFLMRLDVIDPDVVAAGDRRRALAQVV